MAGALNAATVRWAYRFLLGRDPESQVAIDAWCGAASLFELRDGILASPEMAELVLAGFPVTGNWIDSRVSTEAIETLLAIRDGAMPDTATVEDWRRRHDSLHSLRQELLSSPVIERRLPRPEGHAVRKLRLAGAEMTLSGDSREPEFISAPGFAPRYAALLRAAWPDGGHHRVLLESGAGIGVTTLGLAAGAPAHSVIVTYEASLRKAAALEENLRQNGLTRATLHRAEMGPVAAVMEREGLGRLDLLRLNQADAPSLAVELAPWLLENRTMTLIAFNLPQLLIDPGPGPRALLLACCEAFPHVVSFDAAGEPRQLLDSVAVDAALHRTLMRVDRRDEFLLCDDLDWLEAFIPSLFG